MIKNNKRFSIPGSDFTVLKSQIKKAVKDDEETITTKFGIEFCCGFNKALLKPTSDICLSSKISKEDSLVLASSVHMNDEIIINNKVIIFTNDGDFNSWFNESMSEIENVFNSINARTPVIEHISRIGKNQINATDFKITDLQEASINYIQAYILEEYDSLYLGTTTTRATSTDIKNLLCIKSKCGIKIPKSAYIC